jgi:hypothetical protein
MSNTRAGKRPKLGDMDHPLTGGGGGAATDAEMAQAGDSIETDAGLRQRTSASKLTPAGGGEDPANAKTDVEAVLAAGGTRIPGTGAGHGCLHDVVYPPDWKPDPKAGKYDPENPAKRYAFELDTFQKKSVEVMERGESVMVSAHTSAVGPPPLTPRPGVRCGYVDRLSSIEMCVLTAQNKSEKQSADAILDTSLTSPGIHNVVKCAIQPTLLHGQDRGGGVCHRYGSARRAACGVHVAAQGAE